MTTSQIKMTHPEFLAITDVGEAIQTQIENETNCSDWYDNEYQTALSREYRKRYAAHENRVQAALLHSIPTAERRSGTTRDGEEYFNEIVYMIDY